MVRLLRKHGKDPLEQKMPARHVFLDIFRPGGHS